LNAKPELKQFSPGFHSRLFVITLKHTLNVISKTAAAWFALRFVALSIAVGSAQQIPELKPNSAVEHSLSGGQTQEYRIPLSAGQFLQAVVDQKGIDVEVVLVDPAGKQVGHIDSPNSAWGPEPMVAIAEVSGEYRLRVVAGNPQAGPGRYQVRVEALRQPTDQDIKHVNVNREVDQSHDLLAKGDAPSLQLAAEKFGDAIAFYHSSGLSYDEALSLYTVGLIEAERGDFHSALRSDQQALRLFQEISDVAMEGNVILNVGGAYDVLGDLPKALDSYRQALQLIRSKGDRVNEGAALNNIGKIHADMAEWQQASEYYQQALPIFHETGDRGREGTTLNNLGRLSAIIGENSKALEYYQQALQLNRAAGNKGEETETLMNMATVQLSEGQHTEALNLYQQALELAHASGDHWREGVTLRYLGYANLVEGDAQKALPQLQQSLGLLKETADRRGEGLALHVLGQAYAALHQPEQALANYQESLTILQSVGDRNYSAQAMMGIAQVERDQNKLNDARKHAEEALALVEQVRSKAGAQEDRASYFATQQSMGEFYIGLLMRLHQQDPTAGHGAEAFEAAERERARSLLEMLAEARVDIRQGVDPKLLQREHEIAGLLNSNAQRLLTLHGAGTEEKATALKKEISELESESQQLELAIRKSSPQYSAMTQPQPLSLKEIQQQVMDADTVLLEYALGEERSYLWTITPGPVSASGLRSYELPKRSEIEKSVREVVDLLSARGTYIKSELPGQKKARIARADAQLPQAAARLSQMVLAPAAGELGNKRLVLVTDGSLQHVPFAMLPIPGSTTPLVAEHEIVSLPSASTVAELRKQTAGRQPAPKTIAVLADPVFQSDDPRVSRQASVTKTTIANKEAAKKESAPAGPIVSTTKVSSLDNAAQEENSRILVHLAATEADNASGGQLRVPRLPFTRQEADRIIKLAGEKDSFEALDFNASLTTASSAELGLYRYLHFATHGYLDSEQPELSAIVLSLVDKNGQPQTGFLRANDIYNLKLPADLVVLSACQTGLGKEIRGEGIVGLTRGFMYAGVPRVIVSLWSVNDRATEELMAAFYQKLLKEKLTSAAALRQAQMTMMKAKQWSAPYYWAAFLQQGEWQ
jgi:CHAT domain-containing protein/tetratricopeptide (TPR) repeat protein